MLKEEEIYKPTAKYNIHSIDIVTKEGKMKVKDGKSEVVEEEKSILSEEL